MLRLRLALPLVRRRLLDLRVRLGACACSTLLAQDDTAGGRNHGIVCAYGIVISDSRGRLSLQFEDNPVVSAPRDRGAEWS